MANEKNVLGNTTPMLENESSDSKKRLETAKTELSKRSKSPAAILFEAIQENNLELLELALTYRSYGLDAMELGKSESPTDQGDSAILKARMQVRDEGGKLLSLTPLYVAAQNGSTQIVERLLKIPGIDINQTVFLFYIRGLNSDFRQSPLDVAIKNQHLGVVKLLLAHGAKRDSLCFRDTPVARVADMYWYRNEITKELHSWGYQNITAPIKEKIAFFKAHFPQDKAVKLEVAKLIIDVLEGKQDASVLDNLNAKQKLAIGDGRLKVAFENIRDQLPPSKNAVDNTPS